MLDGAVKTVMVDDSKTVGELLVTICSRIGEHLSSPLCCCRGHTLPCSTRRLSSAHTPESSVQSLDLPGLQLV